MKFKENFNKFKISKETLRYLITMFFVIGIVSSSYLLTYYIFTNNNEKISIGVMLSTMICIISFAIIKDKD